MLLVSHLNKFWKQQKQFSRNVSLDGVNMFQPLAWDVMGKFRGGRKGRILKSRLNS